MEFSKTVSDISHKAKQQFLNDHKNLIAVLSCGSQDLFDVIAADLMLDKTTENEIAYLADPELIDQKNPYARDVAREDLLKEFIKQFSLAYLRLRQRGAVGFTIAPTSEALEEEFQLEVNAGCRTPRQAVEAQAAAQTAQRSLDQEIATDWNGGLSTSAIATKKKSNPAYAARLNQMLEGGQL